MGIAPSSFFSLFLLGSWKGAWCNTGAHNRTEYMGVLGLSLEDKLAQDNRGGRRVNHSCRVFSSFQIVAEMTGRQWNADYPKLIGRCDKNETKETVIGVQQQSSELETKDRESCMMARKERGREKCPREQRTGWDETKRRILKSILTVQKHFLCNWWSRSIVSPTDAKRSCWDECAKWAKKLKPVH